MQLPNTIRLVDHSSLGLYMSPLQSFAYDDTFCRSIGGGHSLPIIRSWVHQHTIVLGIQDSRLPFIDEAVQYLHTQGYQSIVRNSGGLAVVLDPGILNLSIILKEEKTFSIDAGYELMYKLIQSALAPYDVDVVAKEIEGSYCPGKFDLSINGKKFAGISQRRVQGGVSVQIYLCVSGCGMERASLIKKFYTLGRKNIETKIAYPNMVPRRMASLSQLLNQSISISDLFKLVLDYLNNENIKIVNDTTLKPQESIWFEEYNERIIKRNEKMF